MKTNLEFSIPRMRQMPGNFFSSLEARITSLQLAGKDIIRLDIGSPDLPPPASVLEALTQSASQPQNHGYTPHNGPPWLRQSWSELYARDFHVSLDPDREILPLLGSKEGIFHLTQALVAPGDVVLIPDPGYMTYSRAAIFAAGEPYLMSLLPENGYLPDFSSIPPSILKRARLLWLNYPNNPTAAVASREFFEQAVEFARQHHILLCHDAAYSQVTFDGKPAASVLAVPGAAEVAVEFNSLSKSHNMAGWRVGALAGNSQAVQALLHLKANIDSGHFLPVLHAAQAALAVDRSWIIERNEVYRQRRDAAVQGLRALGLELPAPQASIYAWCRAPQGWSSQDYVTHILEHALVSLTPGAVFGARGEGYFRLSLTTSTERIREAIQRIKESTKDTKASTINNAL